MPKDAFIYENYPILEVASSVKSHIDFKIYDILRKPHFKEKFDIIVLNNILMHYPEKTRERILENALEILKEGGFLLVEPEEHYFYNQEREKWLTPYYQWRKKIFLNMD